MGPPEENVEKAKIPKLAHNLAY